MWLLSEYILLRLSVNMCVSVWVVCIILMAMSIAFSYARSVFWYHGSLSDMWIFLLGLYTDDFVMSPSIRPSEFLVGGMNDSSVYIHCCECIWGGVGGSV